MSHKVRAKVVRITPMSDSRALLRHLSQLSQQESAGFKSMELEGLIRKNERINSVDRVKETALFMLTSFQPVY
jgi:hypothetical protein